MAVTRRTQKDVGRFEAKLIGPFTTHQTIFLAIGAVLCLFIKLLCSGIGLDTVITTVLMILFGGGCILLGFIKPLGMTMTDYIKLMVETQVLNPGKRPYKSHTDIDCLEVKRLESVAPTTKKTKKGQSDDIETHKPHKKYKEYKEYL